LVFSSPLFLFAFLPALLALYYVTGPKLRNALLLVASLLFYAWGEGTYILVMIAIIAINYALGRWMSALRGRRGRKPAVVLAVVVNLGLLIVFKYSNFLVDHLNMLLGLLHVRPVKLHKVHLPLGISFFTFHALSYVIDISRGTLRSARPLDFALYMTFFPHSSAGPIVRYGDIAGQLAGRIVNTTVFAAGVRRFIIGLAKKMLVANTVAVTADSIFALPGRELTFGLAWLGVAFYTQQIRAGRSPPGACSTGSFSWWNACGTVACSRHSGHLCSTPTRSLSSQSVGSSSGLTRSLRQARSCEP
jgi:alginate O-acetyltransferase complex protein AlgI